MAGLNTLVSVVIPTYGRPISLPEAIESVAAQTYDHIELIVVDDCSPEPVEPALDGTVLRSFPSHTVIRHEENKGANAARSTGIEAANGDIIAFLDDDDRWQPTYLDRVLNVFDRGGSAVGVVMAGERSVDDADVRIGSAVPSCSGDVLEELLAGTVRAAPFSRFAVRSRVIDAAGLPDDRFPSWQDKEWHIRLAQHCQYASVPELLVNRRIADHDQITNNFEAKRDVSYRLFIAKHRELAAEFGPETERRFLATLTRTVGFSALRNGYYRDSLIYLFRALRYDPTATATYCYMLVALGGPLTYKPARRLKYTFEAAQDVAQ